MISVNHFFYLFEVLITNLNWIKKNKRFKLKNAAKAEREQSRGTSTGGVVAQLASSMVQFLLVSMAWQSWPSLVHPRPVGVDWRSGALHR